MGCFDNVRVKCPACGEKFKLQSKGGQCMMRTFSAKSVPIRVALYLDGEIEPCPHCKKKLKVQVEAPKRVKVWLESPDPYTGLYDGDIPF